MRLTEVPECLAQEEEVGVGLPGIESDLRPLDAVVLDLTLRLEELEERQREPEVGEVEADDLPQPDDGAAEVDDVADEKDEDLLAERELDVEDDGRGFVVENGLVHGHGAARLLLAVSLLEAHEDRQEQDMDERTDGEHDCHNGTV